MKPQVLLVKINRVFSSRDYQVDLIKSKNWFAGKGTNFSQLNYFFIQSLSVGDFVLVFVFVFILVPFLSRFRLLILHLIIFFGEVNVETNFAHTVFFILYFGACLDNNIVLVDGGIVDGLQFHAENRFRCLIHGAHFQRRARRVNLSPRVSLVRCGHSRLSNYNSIVFISAHILPNLELFINCTLVVNYIDPLILSCPTYYFFLSWVSQHIIIAPSQTRYSSVIRYHRSFI